MLGHWYRNWIYNYPCNQCMCLSPLMLRVWILPRRGALDTTLCDNVCQWLVTGQWFSLSTLVSSTNKTDRHNITAVLLKMVLNTINLTLHYIVRHNTHILRKIYIEDNIDGIVDHHCSHNHFIKIFHWIFVDYYPEDCNILSCYSWVFWEWVQHRLLRKIKTKI